MSASLARLLAQVLPLALGAAVSPVILALQMLTLTTGTARLLRSWLVAAGAALACGVWTVVGLFVVNRLPVATSHADPTAGAARIALALLLVSLGVRALYHRGDVDAPPPSASDPSVVGSRRLWLAVGLGLGAMISNITSLVLFLPAVHDISRSRAQDSAKAVALGVLVVITLLPALVPPLAASIGGERAARGLEHVSEVVAARRRSINAGICFVFAAYLLVTGLARL